MRNRQSLILSLIIGSAMLVAPMLAQAGGTIKGKVTFSGNSSSSKGICVFQIPECCILSKKPQQECRWSNPICTKKWSNRWEQRLEGCRGIRSGY